MILLGCAVLAIGHLNFSQGLAWVSLSIAHGRTMPAAEAIAATFDCEHSCEACTLVKAERALDDEVPTPIRKGDKQPECAITPLAIPMSVPLGPCCYLESGGRALVGVALRPETPPPQALM